MDQQTYRIIKKICVPFLIILLLGAVQSSHAQPSDDFSVNLNRIEYSDNAGRYVNFDFSHGVMNGNGHIPLPNETAPEFWWLNWLTIYDPIGHSDLNTYSGLFNMSVPQVADYSNDWHIGVYDLEPAVYNLGDLSTAAEWKVSVDSVINATEIQHQYLLSLTISSRWKYYNDGQPKYSAYVQLYYFTGRGNCGGWQDKTLLGRISIRNRIDGGNRWQSAWKFIGDGIDLSNTKIDVSLKLLSKNEISASVRLGDDPTEFELGSIKYEYADIRPMSGVWPSVVLETGYRSTQLTMLEVVIDTLLDIISDNTDSPIVDKIEDVIEKAETALEEIHSFPPDNQAAAGNIEGVVGDLEAAVKDELLETTQGIQLMDDLATVVRKLAECAINQAIDEDGDALKIAEAQEKLAEGKSLRNVGAYKDAVNKYKDALSIAEGELS